MQKNSVKITAKFVSMEIHILGGHGTLIDQYLSEIRDHEIQLDRMRFTRNITRLGEIMAYELSKQLPFVDEEVTTPLGIATVPVLREQPVITSILRAGLPMQQGFINYFDHADNAFIAGFRRYRKNNAFTIKMDYITAPPIDNRIVVLCDVMSATGSSIDLAYQNLVGTGTPQHVHIAVIIASKEAVDLLERRFHNENVTLWLCAVDEALTVKSYIVPGLGDAGDLIYGSKTDS